MRIIAHEHYQQATHKGPLSPPAYDGSGIADLNDIDLFRTGHPVAAYHKMHEAAPICWQGETLAGEPGFWAIASYQDVKSVGAKPEIFSSQHSGINIAIGHPDSFHPLLSPPTLDNMITLDGLPHLELRRAHMPFFTVDYLKALTEKIEAKTAELLDDVAAAGPGCNLVDVFSAQLPLFTLSELLGIPESDRPKLVQWMEDLEMAFYFGKVRDGQLPPTPELMAAFMGWEDRVAEFFEYGRALLKDRTMNPRDDLLSAIAHAVVEDETLPDPYLAGSWLLIFIAGNDTTRNSISGMINLLSQNPDQKSALLADPALGPGCVQESLRMISPVIHMKRIALTDTQIGRQPIKAGEKVVMWYGAANRDPVQFENPDTFNIQRANAAEHLAFGFGKHVCLGKQIALVQLETVLQQIYARFPNMEVSGAMECAPNNFVHAITKLPVTW